MSYHPFRHLGLKFLALALATLLWLTVAGEHVVERMMRVPIEFREIPPRLEVVGDPPASVDVRLRGSSALLSRLQAGEVVAVIDVSDARPGSRLFHIRNEDVRVPYGVEVAQVVPATLAIALERTASRVVPIRPPIEGEPAPGYVVGRITPEPSTVQVDGPESRLRKLTEATTEPVGIEGARERVRDVVTVGLIDPGLRLAEPVNATVIVDIWPAPVERQLKGVPIRWRNLGAGLRARVVPATAQIDIRGRRDALQGVGADTIDAFVDLAGLGPGQYNLRVKTDAVEEFGVVGVHPQSVSVTIR
jgi:YbbR domain-containing protein